MYLIKYNKVAYPYHSFMCVCVCVCVYACLFIFPFHDDDMMVVMLEGSGYGAEAYDGLVSNLYDNIHIDAHDDSLLW